MSLRHPGVHAAAAPDRPAVVMSDTGATWTYADLHAYAARLSRVLSGLGVGVGDHVALCLENRLEVVGVQWGAHAAGTYYTPISTRLAPEEIGYVAANCAAKAVIVSDATAERVLDGLRDAGIQPLVLTVDAARDGARPLAPLLAGQPAQLLDDAQDGSEMLYSSGTTGRPKGIRPDLPGTPLGTTNLVADLLAALFGFGPDSVYLSPAPYYHASPFKYCFGVTALGGTVVLMPRFDAAAALEAIARHGVTHSQWVPTMFQRMLRLDDAIRERYDLSTHRVAIHAAAPCPVPVKEAMIDWWGPILHEFYASSEAIGMCHCTSEQWLERPGTVGRAVLGELQIRGADGELLEPGQEGLVCFAGGRPFAYHEDPEKTAEAYAAGGAATVGDIGRVDEDGFLFLTDRASNMIITGGVNVYPQETENVLAVHPQVADVAVIGIPDEDFGELVCAVVEPADGVEPSDELAAGLIAHAREHLADVKCPRRVDFRETLPREPSGKLIKRRLRDEYWAGRESRLV
jgi:fatty-acyl-CoA synthase